MNRLIANLPDDLELRLGRRTTLRPEELPPPVQTGRTLVRHDDLAYVVSDKATGRMSAFVNRHSDAVSDNRAMIERDQRGAFDHSTAAIHADLAAAELRLLSQLAEEQQENVRQHRRAPSVIVDDTSDDRPSCLLMWLGACEAIQAKIFYEAFKGASGGA